MTSNWKIKPSSKRKEYIEEIMKGLNICKPLALALGAKGVKNVGEGIRLLNPKDMPYADITQMTDVKKSFEIIDVAIENKQKICIYGDYDADGITSTTILMKSLSALGADVSYYIPDRVEEGYGLNIGAVKKIAEKGYTLIITCDNGIASTEEIALANSLGLKVIVYDHHMPHINEEGKQILPMAAAVVDAKSDTCNYPFAYMCAGGLCYRLMKAYYKHRNIPFELNDELLVFAAIATQCDMVEILDENRRLLYEGLEKINTKVTNKGLKKLIEITSAAGTEDNPKEIGDYQLGFIIGPCINAAGRLESAKMAVELFLCDDENKVEQYARDLFQTNNERKLITRKNTDEAIEAVEQSDLINDRVLVLYDETIHESVAGLVAARLKEKFYRPTIVLTKCEEGAKGSARSIEGYDIFKALSENATLFKKFGGHPMAAGMTLPLENVDKLRLCLNEQCTLTSDELTKKYTVVGLLTPEEITMQSANEMTLLKPYGKENEKPLFGMLNVKLDSISFMGSEGRYMRLRLCAAFPKGIQAVAFDGYEKMEKLLSSCGYTMEKRENMDVYADIIFTLDINRYTDKNGILREAPQLTIKDFRPAIKRRY